MTTPKTLILRTTTLTLTLVEAATALGFKEWHKINEYLDADPHNDVYHNGYNARDVKNFSEVVKGANALFPSQVAVATEDAERDAYAAAITRSRHKAIQDCFESLVDLSCEYEGIDSTGAKTVVSAVAGITSVSMNVPEANVEITIVYPEHFINGIIDGMGQFYPTEIFTDVALPDKDLKNYFLGQVKNAFSVWDIRKSDARNLDSCPSVDDEFLKSELAFRIGELETEEIAECIISSVNDGRVKYLEDAITAAVRISARDKKEIDAAVKKLAKDKVDEFTEKMKKFG